MCRQCSEEVVGLHLGKDVYTEQQVVVPVGVNGRGTSRVGLFGPRALVSRFFAERIMPDVRPPLAVAFLGGPQGIVSVRHQWRQYEKLPAVAEVPVLAIGETDILPDLQLMGIPFEALISISESGRITLEKDQRRIIVS